MKRVIVNMVLVLCLAGLGFYCYTAGKSYTLLLENLPYSLDGVEYPGIEAMQAQVDVRREPIFLLDGDRMPTTVVGREHTLIVEILDEDDKVIDAKEIEFSITDLGGTLSINATRAYAAGKVESYE